MSWDRVREFAMGARQFFDLLLVAVGDRRVLAPERFSTGDLVGCLMALTGSDST